MASDGIPQVSMRLLLKHAVELIDSSKTLVPHLDPGEKSAEINPLLESAISKLAHVLEILGTQTGTKGEPSDHYSLRTDIDSDNHSVATEEALEDQLNTHLPPNGKAADGPSKQTAGTAWSDDVPSSGANSFAAAGTAAQMMNTKIHKLRKGGSFRDQRVLTDEVFLLRKDSAWRDKASRAQEAFIFFDEDGSGNLDADELKAALVMIGIDPAISEECVARLMDTIDDDHTNSVDMKEFVEFFTRDLSHDPVLLSIQNAFNQITDDMVEEFNKRSEGMVVGNDRNLIDPRSRLSTDWDIYVAVLLIVTIFTMPLSMAFFDIQRDLQPLDLLADVTFLLDILKHFNTGYIDEHDFTIMDKHKVRYNYGTTWFIPDVLSSVPIEIIELILAGESDVGNLKATKALKLLRLSRIAKIFRILKLSKLSAILQNLQDDFEDYYQIQFDEASIAMGRLFLSLLVLVHWVGCINFMICREFGFPADSWVAHADLVDADVSVQYAWCYFKALGAMVGLGFEAPPIVNTTCLERTTWCTMEHWITLICLYIGSIFYALLITSVSSVMDNLDVGGSALALKLWSLNEYLRNKKIPPEIKDKVRTFYRIQFGEQGKLYDEVEVLGTLPPQIKDEIMAFNFRVLFKEVPLLGFMAPETFISRTVNVLENRLMFPGEIVFEEDTIGNEMFFIESGIIQIYSKHQDAVVKSIADGCYFGDVACLLHCRRTASTQARTNVVMHSVSKNALLVILSDFADLEKYMIGVAQKRRVRMKFLDKRINPPPLTEDELNDDQDSQTKYFLKLSKLGKSSDAVFNSMRDTGEKKTPQDESGEKESGAGREAKASKIIVDPSVFDPEGAKNNKIGFANYFSSSKVNPDNLPRRHLPRKMPGGKSRRASKK
mmetsp:Transcript_52394/g.119473  ORF Transcript_52394/g.119473 Transcript_52394/m.119473 type:complete len:887 (-) Transcript_52394:62-2722(-)